MGAMQPVYWSKYVSIPFLHYICGKKDRKLCKSYQTGLLPNSGSCLNAGESGCTTVQEKVFESDMAGRSVDYFVCSTVTSKFLILESLTLRTSVK